METLGGDNLREIPEEEIIIHLKRRIKYLSRRGLNGAKNAIEKVRKHPDTPRRIGYTTLPKHLMDLAYDLIVEQMETRGQ